MEALGDRFGQAAVASFPGADSRRAAYLLERCQKTPVQSIGRSSS